MPPSRAAFVFVQKVLDMSDVPCDNMQMSEFYNLYMDDVRPIPIGWIGARTVAETKAHLARGLVDRLSLDHDMGACEECTKQRKDVGDMLTPETTFMSWCPHHEDGTKLVHWMIEKDIWSRQMPTCHSANPVGRARMEGMIQRYWQFRAFLDLPPR
jgi:hypothetical protein